MSLLFTIVSVVALVGTASMLVRARGALGGAVKRAAALEVRLAAKEDSDDRQGVLLRTMVETSPVAMVLFTDAGRITLTNRAARLLFFEDEAVEGQNFLAMIERAPEPLRRALLSTGSELFSVEGQEASDTYHLSKQQVDQQTLVAVRNVTHEISRQEIDTLKKVIRVIGHELNNSLGPISSLVSSARLVLQRPDPIPRLAPIFDTISERALHLRTFLDGYATLAQTPRPAPTLVEWGVFLEGLRGLWPALELPAPPEQAGFFDRGQLQQVLINLIKNAYEAGGPNEEVKLVIERPSEGGFRLAVLDRGPGISDEALANGLLPFFTTKPKGSGLGLTLCREIIEAHRGRLRLARREGGGTSVSIWLPDGTAATPPAAANRARLTLTRT